MSSSIEPTQRFIKEVTNFLETNKLKKEFRKVLSLSLNIEENKLKGSKIVIKKVTFLKKEFIPRNILKHHKKRHCHLIENSSSNKDTTEGPDNSKPKIILSHGKIRILNLQSTKQKYCLKSGRTFTTLIDFLVENNYVF